MLRPADVDNAAAAEIADGEARRNTTRRTTIRRRRCRGHPGTVATNNDADGGGEDES